MKFSQALRLGHRSIMGHKRRNLTTIIIIGLLFGLLSGIIFAVQGTEQAILRAADETYGESYYVGAMTNVFDQRRCHQEPIPDQPSTFENVCPPSLVTDAVATIERHGGKVLSQSPNFTLIFAPDSLPSFIPVDLSHLSDDAIAVAAGPDSITPLLGKGYFQEMSLPRQATFIRDELPQTLGTTLRDDRSEPEQALYIAGLLPSANIRSTYDGPGTSLNPFDMILGFLGMSTSSGGSPLIYLDVDSPATQAQLAYLDSTGGRWADNMATFLIRFDDAESARRFSRAEICGMGMSSSDCSRPFLASSSIDNRLDLYEASRFTWGILGIAETIIILIAAIIMLFTFVKVLSDQTAQVRLYRSLGASTADICLIYGAYLLEVCLYSIGFMLLLGLAIAGVVSLLNASAFSDVLTVAYNRTFIWPKILIGWNPDLLKFAIAMFVVAALSLLWFILTKKYQKSARP